MFTPMVFTVSLLRWTEKKLQSHFGMEKDKSQEIYHQGHTSFSNSFPYSDSSGSPYHPSPDLHQDLHSRVELGR